MMIRIIPPDEGKRMIRGKVEAWKRKREFQKAEPHSGGSAPSGKTVRPGNNAERKPLTDKEKSPNMRLWEAIRKDDVQGVKDAIADGADISGKSNRRNPLVSAAINGRIETLKYLISIGMDVNGRLGTGTALTYTAHKCDLDVARILIDAGADVNLGIAKDTGRMIRTEMGMTPLMLAVCQGNEWLAEMLIDKGADVNLRDYYGNTALIFTARYGWHRIAKKLLESGADPNARDPNWKTPAKLAEENNYTELAEMIISMGGTK